MNELCFTIAVLNLNKFLNIDFNKQKISSSCARKVLCLDYSNLGERRKIVFVLNGIFYERKMFQPRYHWVEIKYLGTIQNRRGQFFAYMIMRFLNIRRHLPRQLLGVDVS